MSTFSFETSAGADAQARITAVAVVAAVVATLLTLAIVSLLSRPSSLRSRVSSLDARIARVEALRKRSSGRHEFPVGSICTVDPGHTSAALHAFLQNAGASMHLPLLNVSTLAEPSSEDARVEATHFTFNANGDYASAVGLLQLLSRYRPSVLIERIDLVSKTSFIHMHLDGRVYCWTRAAS